MEFHQTTAKYSHNPHIHMTNKSKSDQTTDIYIVVPKVSSHWATGQDLQLHFARTLEDMCGYNGIRSQLPDNIRANDSSVFSHGIIFKTKYIHIYH